MHEVPRRCACREVHRETATEILLVWFSSCDEFLLCEVPPLHMPRGPFWIALDYARYGAFSRFSSFKPSCVRCLAVGHAARSTGIPLVMMCMSSTGISFLDLVLLSAWDCRCWVRYFAELLHLWQCHH